MEHFYGSRLSGGVVAALFELLTEQLSMPRVSVILGGAAVLHREAEKRGVKLCSKAVELGPQDQRVFLTGPKVASRVCFNQAEKGVAFYSFIVSTCSSFQRDAWNQLFSFFPLAIPWLCFAFLFHAAQYGNKAWLRSKTDSCLLPAETEVRLVYADYKSSTRSILISFRQCSMFRLSGPSP